MTVGTRTVCTACTDVAESGTHPEEIDPLSLPLVRLKKPPGEVITISARRNDL
jgi:hypothetical protein